MGHLSDMTSARCIRYIHDGLSYSRRTHVVLSPTPSRLSQRPPHAARACGRRQTTQLTKHAQPRRSPRSSAAPRAARAAVPQRVRRQQGTMVHGQGCQSRYASHAASSAASATPTLLAELVRDWRRALCGWASRASPNCSSTAARTARETSIAHTQCGVLGEEAAVEEERARTAAKLR